MSHDEIIRTAAVVAAVALLAAPYRQQLAEYAAQAAEAAKQHGSTLGRIAAALLILAAAWGKIPLPSLPATPSVPAVHVETPSDGMKQLVQPVARALAALPISDRMLWAETWSKAAVVAAGDVVTAEKVFTDTRSLRLFTTLALDIAWRRIGGKPPGSVEGLRDATEAAYNTAVGREVVPVDKSVIDRYVEFAKAMAWAGVNEG